MRAFDRVALPPFGHLVVRQAPDVYVFDLLTPAFCRRLLAYTDRQDAAPPNTMNRYGAVLREIGLGSFAEVLLRRVVAPLARRFYPGVGPLRGTHGFLVEYSPDTQSSLGAHSDDSAVTLNVCLGRKFEGGDLAFELDDGREVRELKVQHAVGQAVLHRGQQYHRARRVTSGRRTNLILWCKRGRYE
jgi:hypothetical protein